MKNLYLLLICTFSLCNAQTQYYDSSFGTNGMYSVTSPYGSSIYTVIESGALTVNNKVLITGSYPTVLPQYTYNENTNFVRRLNSDGSVDASFNQLIRLPQSNGFQYDNLYLSNITIQPDNKILVGELACKILLRLNENGTIDTTFANNGVLTRSAIENILLPYNLNQVFLRKIVINNNKIFISFDAQTNAVSNFYKVTILCLNMDGSVNTTFANNGILTQDGVNGELLIQNSKLILFSQVDYNTGTQTIKRYNSDGQVDTTFNNGIVQIIAPSNFDVFSFSFNLSNNAIFMSGFAFSSVGELPLLTISKLSNDGILDTTFGNGGLLSERFYPISVANYSVNSNGLFQDLLIDQDENLYYVTTATPTGSTANYNQYIKKFSSNGTVDNNFGSNGIVEVDLNGGESLRSSFIQPDGRIMLFGYTSDIPRRGIATRILNNSTFLSTQNITAFKKKDFSVFPNPAENILNIKGKLLSNNATIFDSSGKLIMKKVARKNAIDVSDLNSGIYFLQINDQSLKFIKK